MDHPDTGGAPRTPPLLAGIHHHNAGRTAQARACYRQALALEPAHADASRLLGLLEWRDGALDLAIGSIRRALLVDPLASPLRLTLADAMEQGGHGPRAGECLRRAIALDPADVTAWGAVARKAAKDRAPVQALAVWRILAALCPDRPSVLSNLAGALRDAGQPAAALEAARRAVALDPGGARLHHDLALMFDAMVDTVEAVTAYRRAARIEPGLVETQVNLALRLLSLGDFAEGWTRYEWRLAQDERTSQQTLPAWRGEEIAGRPILVWSEQGIGDEIMFASCLPDFVARAGRVTLTCEPRLAPLFTRSFPEITVLPAPVEDTAKIDAELQAAAGSLPRWLRPDATSFPQRHGYLRTRAGEAEEFRRQFPATGAISLGVSWHTTAETRRSIPLGDLVGALPGAQLVNLQYGNHERELADVAARRGTTIWQAPGIDPLTDLDRYAALIAALDLVVTIDNTTAHLAGALGVATWILLPTPSDWRWFGGRHGCLWYPQARLFQQRCPGDWSSVLDEVGAAFAQYAGDRRP